MAIANSIKRAPRWAWFTVAGISAGAIAIKVFKDRDNEPSEDGGGTEVGSPTYGSPGTSAGPTPVITPPVIIGGNNGDNGGLASYVSTIGGNFDTLVGALVGMGQGAQELSATSLVTGWGTIGEIATGAIANAGSPPAPIVVNPTPVTVNVPAPAAPAAATPQNQPRLWNGHTLTWWQNPAINRKNGDWRWPDGKGFVHSRHFNGN